MTPVLGLHRNGNEFSQNLNKLQCSCIKLSLAGPATHSPVRRGNNCSAPFSQHRKKSEKRKTERVDAESAFERELVLARKSSIL